MESKERKLGVITFVSPLNGLDSSIDIIGEIENDEAKGGAYFDVGEEGKSLKDKKPVFLTYKPLDSFPDMLRYQPAKISTGNETYVSVWYAKRFKE